VAVGLSFFDHTGGDEGGNTTTDCDDEREKEAPALQEQLLVVHVEMEAEVVRARVWWLQS